MRITIICYFFNVHVSSYLYASGFGGLDGGSGGFGMLPQQGQQMQMRYMADQLRKELQQRSFLTHAQVSKSVPNSCHHVCRGRGQHLDSNGMKLLSTWHVVCMWCTESSLYLDMQVGHNGLHAVFMPLLVHSSSRSTCTPATQQGLICCDIQTEVHCIKWQPSLPYTFKQQPRCRTQHGPQGHSHPPHSI